MCVVSMVHDHYENEFNKQWPVWQPPAVNPSTPTITWPVQQPIDVGELKRLIADFREAIEAAKKVDALTKQPDCVDPEKAKLQERVDRLEKIIDALIAAKGKG